MPIEPAVAVDERAAAVAGVDRGIDLEQARQRRDPSRGSVNERSSPEMTPARPSRTARTASRARTPRSPGGPRRGCRAWPGRASAGGCRADDRDVVLGWVATICAGDFEPSANVRSMVFAPSTTWRLVRMSPSRLTTTPLPSPAWGSGSASGSARRRAVGLDQDERRLDRLVDDSARRPAAASPRRGRWRSPRRPAAG